MTFELIKCPNCVYQYHTDITKFIEDGEIPIVRKKFSNVEKIFRRNALKSVLFHSRPPIAKMTLSGKLKLECGRS
jgi:hypothetical protein